MTNNYNDNHKTVLKCHWHHEKAVIVAITFVYTTKQQLAEFRELVVSTGAQIVAQISAKRHRPEAKYFVGQGKAQEILIATQQHGADLVIFNHELTPAQQRNLEKLLTCKVLDRTSLILDIFAKRAKSFEGKLQVELAQLEHLATRLIRGWTHLERQKGGIGLRGPGETQLETDRRLINHRIHHIKKRLKKVRSQRYQSHKARQRALLPTVALIGYTNAGKSTLFNNLTANNVYTANQLFATLDPTLGAMVLPIAGKTIVADTVGFISKLPHHFIAAFCATLEQTRDASLLVHVIDASDDNYHDKITEVTKVLKQIEATHIPVLEVFNKIDLQAHLTAHIDYNKDNTPKRVWLSAKQNIGIGLLHHAITECLCQEFIHCSLCLPPQQQRLRVKLYKLNAIIKERTDKHNNIILEIRLSKQDYNRWVVNKSNSDLVTT